MKCDGEWHITYSVFRDLGISLMAGELDSLFLSRTTVPILYFLDKRWELAATVPPTRKRQGGG